MRILKMNRDIKVHPTKRIYTYKIKKGVFKQGTKSPDYIVINILPKIIVIQQ